MASQTQQLFVAGDQQVGVTAGGENQELLVVAIAAARQRIIFLAAGVADA